MVTNYIFEEIGPIGVGTANYDHSYGTVAIHPQTGLEHIIHTTFASGFIVVDPRSGASRHIRPANMITSREAFQGPDGAIYQFGDGIILRWNWQGNQPEAWFSPGLPDRFRGYAHLDFDHLGNVYYTANWRDGDLWRACPGSGRAPEKIATAAKPFGSSPHRCVYLVRHDRIDCLNPETGAVVPVLLEDGSPCPPGEVRRDGGGRLVLTAGGAGAQKSWHPCYLELAGPWAFIVDAAGVRLADTLVCSCECHQAAPNLTFKTPYVLADGTYVSRVIGPEMTLVAPDGRWRTITLESAPVPLEPFALAAGTDRIWIGSILPLNLVSWNPATAEFANHGCPTPSVGEIYNLLWSRDRLFYVSYTHAQVSRYAPGRPWRLDNSPEANPRQFGAMVPGEICLHRSYGKTLDEAGNVYFSAAGDYGCRDSGICRIDLETEDFRVWTYPDTLFAAMTHVRGTNELLLAECRAGEGGCRLSTVVVDSGEMRSSQLLFPGLGRVNSLCHPGGRLAFGVHDASGTLFSFDLHGQRIDRRREVLDLGHFCYNSLLPGPDGRLWGLTSQCVYAIDRELREVEVLARYAAPDETAFYRFAFDFSPDGSLYFLKGDSLVRLRRAGKREKGAA